jgi:NAD(P)H-dependent flavin oxidoreductase YrpB (nitropropane dioxygenase family)
MEQRHIDIITRAIKIARTQARVMMNRPTGDMVRATLKAEINEYDDVLSYLEIKIDEKDKGCCAEDCQHKKEKYCVLYKTELYGTQENPTRCPQCFNYIS